MSFCTICGTTATMASPLSVNVEPRCPRHVDTSISPLSRQVAEFHRMAGQPILGRPQVPDNERVRLRLKLIAEEFTELMEAAGAPYVASIREIIAMNLTHDFRIDLPAFVDAMADLDYVVEGTRLEFGVNGAPIADVVHAANMAKMAGPTREDGKKLKPPGWQPPDIVGELKKQGWEG